MQIGCPQCSMQYDLDPRLLPPAGASVQCTRCRFVFTATPSGEVLSPGEASRTSSTSSTRIFGNPFLQPPQAAAPPPATTQVFGVASIPQAPPEDSDVTPAYGTEALRPPEEGLSSATPGASSAAAPAVGKTQAFGVAPARILPPTTTQVFGAVSVPEPQSPPVATTQVFGASALPPQPSAPPPPATTQVFGAVSVPVPQAPPATTQVFGAVSVPMPHASPATTQVFGASALPPQPSAPPGPPATTQVFGAQALPLQASAPPVPEATSQVRGAARARPAEKGARGAPAPSSRAEASVPWMVEPGPAQARAPRSATGERRPPPPPAAPIALPPEESVAQPVLPSLPPEPVQGRGPTPAPRRSSSADLSEVFGRLESEAPARAPATGSGRERLMIVLAAVGVLGLTAWLTYPSWRDRSSEMPPEALRAQDEAVVLLRRDDAASREQAIARLRPLVGQFPKFTQAQAELAVALSLKLDDIQVELDWIREQENRLRKEISSLQLAQSPADWPSRVNTRREELEALRSQRQPLEAAVAEVTPQLEESLLVIRAAPEAEPAADVVARLKAQAIHAGVASNPQALALADRLRKVETPPIWSAVSLAEYGLNARSPPSDLVELSEALREVRERDNTFLRAYMLGARLALRQRDPATARALLDSVVALNPNHSLARKLQQWAAEAAEATAVPTP